MPLPWQIDTALFDELTNKPYNPPSITGPEDAAEFDAEFTARVAALKQILEADGYIEMYDVGTTAEMAHYHLVIEHSGDRSIAIELLHSRMGHGAWKWISRVQQQLAQTTPSYQVVVTTSFDDHDGVQLLPGFAGLVIRPDVVVAHFSTPAMAEFFRTI